MYTRIENLLGKDNLTKLYNAKILLVGLGGVGSFCFEALIRSGIKNITIVDFDVYEESNLNRQLYSSKNNIGKYKTEQLQVHARQINDEIIVKTITEKLDKDSKLDFKLYDYIIDACDNIEAKIYLITKAFQENIPIVSSMGVGNRLDPLALRKSFLDKTYNDPLAKRLRSNLNKIGFKNKVKVVFSQEIPCKQTPVSSYIGVSSTAGILLADVVIKDLIDEKDN